MSDLGLQSWRRLWGELGATAINTNGGLLNQLLAAYSEPHRRYHTLQHVREGLAYFDATAMLARRPAEVELALWFHDAVYDPRRSDNEERSAQWARDSVLAADCAADVADRVAALVLATAHHTQASDDPDTQLLLDIDLSILGSAPARFEVYEQEVRAEYAHVDDAAFRAGRAALVEAFLRQPRLYATAAFHDALEARARDNLQRSLERLRPAA
jgi:predicted metal-dependent HD superfamily phosphohydrolase